MKHFIVVEIPLLFIGSYKIRGAYGLMKNLPAEYGTLDKPLISMSAGNFGKAFAYMCQQLQLSSRLLMPTDAPMNRTAIIEVFSCSQ